MADIYPDQKGYLVNWLGGSGGGFLLTLIYINETGLAGPYTITNQAVGHHNLRYLNKNWDKDTSLEYHEKYLNKAPIYQIIKPHNAKRPVYFYDHYPCDPDVFFSMYPSCKLAVVALHDEQERQLCYGNLFLKTNGLFKATKQNNLEKFQRYESQNDIPLNVLEEYLTNVYDCVKIDEIFQKNIAIPDNYQDKMFKVDYKKLVSDKEYIINITEQITMKEPNQHTVDFVDQYLKKQRHLVETKMPWLLDYLYNT